MISRICRSWWPMELLANPDTVGMSSVNIIVTSWPYERQETAQRNKDIKACEVKRDDTRHKRDGYQQNKANKAICHWCELVPQLYKRIRPNKCHTCCHLANTQESKQQLTARQRPGLHSYKHNNSVQSNLDVRHSLRSSAIVPFNMMYRLRSVVVIEH